MFGKRKYSVFILLLLVSFSAVAQQPTELEGRVYSKDNDVSGIHVMNSTTQRATVTDANGFFTIAVQLNDTLIFSAVQFKRKQILIRPSVLESSLVYVPLEDVLTELDEVIVMPYNLTGDLTKDMKNLSIDPVVTSSSLRLPNADVRVKTKNERRLFEADRGAFVTMMPDTLNLRGILELITIRINTHKIMNRLSGRTKKIKRDVATDKKLALLEKVRRAYPDSVFVQELKIPKAKHYDFMYYCEADSLFSIISNTNDKLRLWEFLQKKSVVYRRNN
ncbi:MAG: carboxypeptidase-like regulatory domain-containing protein [Flavobacteriaceae bacterium]